MESDPSLREELIASQPELLRLARRLARDPHLAEDLVQETNLVALDPRRPAADARPRWIRGVLRKLFQSKVREAARRRRREREVAVSPVALEPLDESQRQEIRRVLDALRNLHEPYRATLVARYLHGHTPAEIAADTGAPLRTVHTRTTRGLALLRAELRRRQRKLRGWLGALRWLGSPAWAPAALLASAGLAMLLGPRTAPPFPGTSHDTNHDAILGAPRERVARQAAPVSEYELLIATDAGELHGSCPLVEQILALEGRARTSGPVVRAAGAGSAAPIRLAAK